MKNILDVKVTDKNFILDFGDFQIETSKGYIKEIESLDWYNGCLMIIVPGDIESIGLEHLLLGEPPFYISGDCVLKGKSLSINEILEYTKEIKSVRWLK